MAEIKDAATIASKWATVTPQRSADYDSGIKAPKRDWAQATAAAQPAWESGVQAAVQQKTFARGVAKSGTGKWQSAAVSKGVARWGPGVQLAQDAYQSGVAPYVEAIRRTTLPARFARRDPRNLDRVKVIVDALVKTKTQQGGR